MALNQFDSTFTRIDLVNIALSYINQPSISSLEERSEAAFMMRMHWPLSIRTLLNKANWSFALDRSALVPLEHDEEDALYPNYEYCYVYPDGLIRLSAILTQDGIPIVANSEGVIKRPGSAPIVITKYKILGNKILSNEEGLILEYVKYTENINVFPPSFINCIAYDLAARCAKTLVDSASYVEQMRNALSQELMQAMNLDAS